MSLTNNLEIRTHQIEDNVVIELVGRMDSITAPYFDEKISEIINNTNETIIFDMHQVTYISSVGLRKISEIANRLDKKSRSLIITALSKNVENVFRITNFSLLISVTKNLYEALKQVKKNGKRDTSCISDKKKLR